jgi:hypothetical protein
VSAYAKMIREMTDCTARQAAFVEAWMRLEHPTLDALSRDAFATAAIEARACVREATDEQNVSLALSFGLQAKR